MNGATLVLAVGEVAPEFTLSDQHGEELVLTEMLVDGPVALVFVPFAFSRICTGEFAELGDELAKFESHGVRLLGVSVDSVWTLRAWADQEGFDFSILSDFWPHGETARAYGAFVERTGAAARATVIIDQDRRVAASFETPVGEPRALSAYREALAELRG